MTTPALPDQPASPSLTSSDHPLAAAPVAVPGGRAASTTLTAAQVIAHARFSEPGIDKSSALMILYFTAGWLEAWYGRPVVRARFEAWQHGPTDPAAHAAFAETLPRHLRLPDDQMLELAVQSVAHWALGGKPGQRGTVHSSALITAAKETRAYATAATTGKPAFASGPEIPADLLRDTFLDLAEGVAAGTAEGPTPPGEEEKAEADRQAEAKRLRAQLAERFDTGPNLLAD